MLDLEEVRQILRKHFEEVTPRDFLRRLLDIYSGRYRSYRGTEEQREGFRRDLKEVLGIDIAEYDSDKDKILDYLLRNRIS